MSRLDELTQTEEDFMELVNLCNDLLNNIPLYARSWHEWELAKLLVKFEVREEEEED